MTSTDKFSFTGIHSNSKKIKKFSKKSKFTESCSPDSGKAIPKEYTTYTKAQRQGVVADLWEECQSHIGKNKRSADYLVKHLEVLEIEEYNQIIEKILAKNIPRALLPKKNKANKQKDMKQWRRRLKSWVKSIEKPDKRGNVRVVADEKVLTFKERISQVLQEMPTRSFYLLRQKALGILEQMHKDDETATQPFDRNTFSKHFWYDFKKKHQDIEKMYDSLPITRNKTSANPKQNKATYKDMDEETEDPSSDSPFSNPSGSFECSTEDNSIQNEKIVLDEHPSEYSLFSPITVDGLEDILQNDVIIQDCDAKLQQEPKFDFYKSRKMIVETEDNETQKNFFRLFCQIGL